jgi:hypothetical protein
MERVTKVSKYFLMLSDYALGTYNGQDISQKYCHNLGV